MIYYENTVITPSGFILSFHPFFVSCGDDEIYGDIDFEKATLHEIKRELQGSWSLETVTYKDKDSDGNVVDYTQDDSYRETIFFRNEEYMCSVMCIACFVMPARWEVPKWEKKITVTGKVYYCCTPELHSEFAPIKIEADKLTILENNESRAVKVYKRIVEY